MIAFICSSVERDLRMCSSIMLKAHLPTSSAKNARTFSHCSFADLLWRTETCRELF